MAAHGGRREAVAAPLLLGTPSSSEGILGRLGLSTTKAFTGTLYFSGVAGLAAFAV